MPSSRLGAFCDKIIEAGWLVAVIATPLFFNVYSSRVFEPDKLTLLRSIASVMAAAWIIRWIEQRNSPRPSTTPSLRSALVLPTLIVAAVYLLTTLTSITPRVSFFGSYQRLQGTYTTLSYIVVFFMILQGLRTRQQLDRLILTIILTSLPIALYGLIQRYKLDPLPWGGDVTVRVASNMGNPIFVAAYLIMAFFLTLSKIVESFRSILTEEEAYISDILRAAGYVFIAAVQAIAIAFAGSRGPYIGLLTGSFVFGLVFLVDLRRQAPDQEAMTTRDAVTAIVTAIGCYAIPGLFAAMVVLGVQSAARDSGMIRPAGIVAGILAALVVGVWLLASRKTWKWLWLSWVVAAFIAAGAIGVVNVLPPTNPVVASLRSDPDIGRMANLIETEGGTGKVRTLIWEGNTQLVPPHDPIRFPDGTPDPLNLIRPLIGYGPESMYVAYNRFYPPDLAHIESRNASPDRSHNETWDSLVITGVIGLLAYQFLFISFFIFGFQRVGMMPSNRERNIFIGLWVSLGLLGGLATIVLRQPKYFGMGVPMGILVGVVLYLIIFAMLFYNREQQITLRREDRILFAGLLAGVVAHYIEIHFGIAIASTRTLFWTFAGILAVVGSGWINIEDTTPAPAPDASQPSRASVPMNVPRHKKRRQATRPLERPTPTAQPIPAWIGSVAGYSFITAIILSTSLYEFVQNVQRLSDPTLILWRALTYLSIGQRPVTSYAILGMIVLVWLLASIVAISEMSRSRMFKGSDRPAGLALYASLSMGAALVFGVGLAGLLGVLTRIQVTRIEDTVMVADRVAGIFNYYYMGVFLLILLAGLAFVAEYKHLPATWSTNGWGLIALVPAILVTYFWINFSNLDSIRADIVYKQGDSWDKQGQQDAAIAHYKHAIELAPNEDFYYLFLGKVFLDKASVTNAAPTSLFNDQTQLEGILNLNPQQTAILGRTDLLQAARAVLTRAREINPLNTDHSANLARLYQSWANLATDPAQKAQLAEQSSQYYAQATSLSPHNAVLWDEWARGDLLLRNDPDAALQKLQESLKLDTEFDQTYAYLGEVYMTKKDYDNAIPAYQKLLALQPNAVQAQAALAYIYAQQNKIPEAIQANQNLIEMAPTSPNVWDAHKNLALLYAQTGNLPSAINEAQIAASTAPTDTQPQLIAFVSQLRSQMDAATQPPTSPVTATSPMTP